MSREEIIHQNAADAIKGVIGCGFNVLAVLTSHLAELEAWLRISSLCVGIAVGLATFLSITRRK